MKTAIRLIVLSSILSVFSLTTSAQSVEASLTPSTTTTTTTVKEETPAVKPAYGKEITVAFKNNSEKPVAIFYGPKENIRDPKIYTYGGLSKYNTLYVRENEVVCMMNVQKLPIACAVVKPGVTLVEVNTSALAITAK